MTRFSLLYSSFYIQHALFLSLALLCSSGVATGAKKKKVYDGSAIPRFAGKEPFVVLYKMRPTETPSSVKKAFASLLRQQKQLQVLEKQKPGSPKEQKAKQMNRLQKQLSQTRHLLKKSIKGLLSKQSNPIKAWSMAVLAEFAYQELGFTKSNASKKSPKDPKKTLRKAPAQKSCRKVLDPLQRVLKQYKKMRYGPTADYIRAYCLLQLPKYRNTKRVLKWFRLSDKGLAGVRKAYGLGKWVDLWRAESRLRIAEWYFRNKRWKSAIRAYRTALQQQVPWRRLLLHRLVEALAANKQVEKAIQERKKIVSLPLKKQYSADWIRQLDQGLLKRNLYQQGIFQHTACNIFRQRSTQATSTQQRARLLSRAKASCKEAVGYYRRLLVLEPQRPDVYSLYWYHADALYFSKQYKKAALLFKKVRNWSNRKKYRLEASYSLVDTLVRLVNRKCRQKQLQRACELSGTSYKPIEITQKGTPTKQRKFPKVVIPALQKRLIRARQHFLGLQEAKKDARALTQSYLLARIFYHYQHFGVARKHLWSTLALFMKRYPKTYKTRHHTLPIIRYTINTLLGTYSVQGDVGGMREVIKRLRKMGICDGCPKEPHHSRRPFWRARKLSQFGKWEKAANAFVQAVNKNPKHKDAAAALWNAAIYYEKVRRYGSSVRLFLRISREYPRWEMADQALFYVAFYSEKYFKPKEALNHYLKLINSRVYQTSRKRADAMYNAVLLLEGLQRYHQAARLCIRYAREFSLRADAPNMLFRAALLYKKGKKTLLMMNVLQQFIRKYTWDDKQGKQLILSHGYRMKALQKKYLLMMQKNAPTQQKRKLWRSLQQEYKAVIHRFAQSQGKLSAMDRRVTQKYPAEAAFSLNQHTYYQPLLAMGIKSRSKRGQKKELQKLLTQYSALKKASAQTTIYKSTPWFVCSLFHLVKARLHIAKSIESAPLPRLKKKRWSLKAARLYREQRKQKFIQPLRMQAKSKLVYLAKIAQRRGLQDKCSREVYTLLHQMDPKSVIPKRLIYKHRPGSPTPLPLIQKLPASKKQRLKPQPRSR